MGSLSKLATHLFLLLFLTEAVISIETRFIENGWNSLSFSMMSPVRSVNFAVLFFHPGTRGKTYRQPRQSNGIVQYFIFCTVRVA